jgi:hypothetical protein
VSRILAVLNRRVRPLSATQLDGLLEHAEDLDRFYETACTAIQRAVLGIDNPRARRRAEHEAIRRTLEKLGLVTRTRGTRPAQCAKAARLS